MSHKKPIHLPLGSIAVEIESEPALIEAYFKTLQGLRLTKEERFEVRQARRHWDLLPDTATLDLANKVQGEVLQVLELILEDHCPDYTVLGRHQHDETEVGVWVDHEQLQRDENDGNVLRCTELPPASDTPVGMTHALQVNDHGNMTLWRTRRAGNTWRWVKVWAVT